MARWLLDRAVGLLICLVVVSSENKKYVNLHLDTALHHYDTLLVDQISHTHSADLASRSHQITFDTLGLQFSMILKWNSHILAKDFSVYSIDKEGRRHLHDIDQHAFLRGHLENEELTTMVSAHISDEGILSAVIVTPNDTYHIEPSGHYIKEPHPFHMVAYAKSHVKQRLNSTRFDFQVPPPVHTLSKEYRQTDTTQPKDERLRRQTVDMGNIAGSSCNIALVADFFAFEMFGSIQSTASQLVLLMSSVDMMIYRPTEWILDVNDNSRSGLDHTINFVLIHSEPSSDPMDYYRGDLDVSAGDILGLMQFGGWAESCLAHLLTNRNFPSGLLGLANIASASPGQTGGICSSEFRDFSFDPPRPIIFNTGLSTYNNNGQQMVLAEMVRVVGHELGHNWGTHHDPDTPECGSNFLMNEFAQDGSEDSHMVFSNCSRRSIGAVLLSKAGCFRDPSMCGNYAVDDGEECDVGTTGDQCCTSDCTLIEECSDMNSPCCENCALAAADSLKCRAGAVISTDCTGDTYCNGVDLTCPSAGLSVPNGTRCVLGICLLSNESSSTTECVPLCETMGLSLCTCDEEEEECMVCCSGPGRACRPIDGEPLVDGSSCQGGEGVCRNGGCSDRGQDIIARVWTIIVTLNANAFKEFLDENIVLFTLLFSIPLWCFWSCLLHWLVDHPRTKKMEQSLDKTDVAQVFMARSYKPPVTQEKVPLLEYNNEPVNEPEDDLPPPKYSPRDT